MVIFWPNYGAKLNLFEGNRGVLRDIFCSLRIVAVEFHFEVLELIEGIVLFGCSEGLKLFFKFDDFDFEEFD
jgi:hypothetical protein